jgi:hypothetical protein
MDDAAIRAGILRVLGSFSKETPGELERRLLVRSNELPLDSFQCVAVWQELERVFAVEFGYDFEAEKALRSVARLTLYIAQLRRDAGLDQLRA